MKTLPPAQDVTYSEYQKEIKKALLYFYDFILEQDENLINSKDPLEMKIIQGKIFYKDGAFRGVFDSKTSKKLRDLGAIWKKDAFYIPSDRLPVNYLSAIAQGNIRNDRQARQLLDNLMKIDPNRVAEKADIKKMISRTVDNVNKNVDETAKKVPTIKLQLDPIQLDSVKSKYTESTKLRIVGWSKDEVDFLRKKVNEQIRNGIRYEQLAKEIMKRKVGISESKALFIARQETHLIMAAIKEQKFTKAGFHSYIWKIRKDDKVRHDHDELSDKIFRWEDPPVVDTRTGRRGNPGEDYNCRCYALPIVE